MLNFQFLTPLANAYMSKYHIVDKKASMETTLISINENITALEHLKEALKNNGDKISIANLLSIGLSVSEQTASVSEATRHLMNHKQN